LKSSLREPLSFVFAHAHVLRFITKTIKQNFNTLSFTKLMRSGFLEHESLFQVRVYA